MNFAITEPLTEAADIGEQAAHVADMLQRVALAEHAGHRETGRQIRVGGVVYCVDCDAPIPERRLAANPSAFRCIYCQRDADGTRIAGRA
jgi:phage/conjugal plasmid C-4 type zinc finger TraR family protein